MSDLHPENETHKGDDPADKPLMQQEALVGSAIYEQTKAEDRTNKRSRKFRHAYVWIEAACAIALVIITWFYTHYAHQQVEQLVKQYPELKKSADAAKDSAEAAKQAAINSIAAFHSDQRAWVMTPFKPTDIATFRYGRLYELFTIKNAGKTAALKMRAIVVLKLFETNEAPDFDAVEKDMTALQRGELISGRSNSGGVAFNVGILFPDIPKSPPFYGEAITKNQWAKYPRSAYVAMYGSIAYDDVFGHHHWTHFCSFECSNEDKSFDDNRRKCADYNGVDNDTE